MIFHRTNDYGNIFGTYYTGSNQNEVWCNYSTTCLNMRFLSARFPSGGSYSIDTTTPLSISVTYDADTKNINYYVNSELVFNSQRVFDSNEYGITLGMRKQGSSSNSKFYTVRYYTECLTSEEVRHNYQMDKTRFQFE